MNRAFTSTSTTRSSSHCWALRAAAKRRRSASSAGSSSRDRAMSFLTGKDITRLPPYKRQVNTVFQKYALFPHLNVFENVAFGLRLQKVDEKEIAPRVPGDAGAGGPEGLRAAQHGHALRRAAAARGHRPGAGEPSEGAVAGRAAGRAGPEAAQGYADRAQAHPAEPWTSPSSMSPTTRRRPSPCRTPSW